MKAWNKPIRIYHHQKVWVSIGKPARPYKRWGITNWMVGTCTYPWSPWIQISLCKFSIQIKYYILVATGMIGMFLFGTLL